MNTQYLQYITIPTTGMPNQNHLFHAGDTIMKVSKNIMRILLSAVLPMFLLSVLPTAALAADTAESLYSSANQFEEEKFDGDAKVLYQRVLETYPDSEVAAGARLHSSRYSVLSLIASGNDAAAQTEIAAIRTGFPNHPDLPWYLYGIGNQYEELKRNDDAKAIYQEIIQQYPNSPVIDNARVHFSKYKILSFIDSGNDAAVQSEIAEIITAFPNHPDLTWFYLTAADKYEMKRKYRESKGIYEQIVRQFSDSSFLPGTKFGFNSYARLQLARFAICTLADSSIESADSALLKMKSDFATNPMLTDAIFRTAEIIYEKGLSRLHRVPDPNSTFLNWTAASIETDVIGKTTNKTFEAEAYYLLAETYYKLGDYTKALPNYRVILAVDPNFMYAQQCIFMIGMSNEKLINAGLVNQAQAISEIRTNYERLIKEFPNCRDAEYVKGWLERNKMRQRKESI
jgi:TolA-binding protein